MKNIPKYAYGNEQKLVVASVDFAKKTFNGCGGFIANGFTLFVDEKIDNYKFYDDEDKERPYIFQKGKFVKVG